MHLGSQTNKVLPFHDQETLSASSFPTQPISLLQSKRAPHRSVQWRSCTSKGKTVKTHHEMLREPWIEKKGWNSEILRSYTAAFSKQWREMSVLPSVIQRTMSHGGKPKDWRKENYLQKGKDRFPSFLCSGEQNHNRWEQEKNKNTFGQALWQPVSTLS